MAYLLSNGAVFLHTPKTGGTFISRVLKKLDLVHKSVGGDHIEFDRLFWYDRFHHDNKVFRNLIRRSLGWLPKINPNGFVFCFVREPLAWYVSYWRYMHGRDWRPLGDAHNPYHWSPLSLLNGLGDSDFNTFMHNVNRKRPGFVTELYGWYVRPGISFVGKTENLQRDLVKVLQMMELDVDVETILSMPPQNESPSHIALPQWDPALRKETLKLEYAGYVRFGYPVDDSRIVPALRNGHRAEAPKFAKIEEAVFE